MTTGTKNALRRLLSCAFAAALIVASAGPSQAGVNGREARQAARIRQGLHDGSLTGREAHRLAHRQRRIERMEQRFRRSGDGLGPRERARLDRALDRSSARIWRQRHDGQSR
jgi:hypothetical protein